MKGILTFLSLVCHILSYSQSTCDYKFDYMWIMGDKDIDTVTTDEYGGSVINFNTSPFSIELHPKHVRIPFQNATMSTKEGKLAFYSNGCAVFNKLDNVMLNGDNLNAGEIYPLVCPSSGYAGIQNMISIPDSYNDSIYYLFHIALAFNPKPDPVIFVQGKYVYYTKINMFLDSGNGVVIEKNVEVLVDTNLIASPLTAVKHTNGMDWWLISPNRWGNSFHIILLNELGPQSVGIQNIGLKTSPFAEAGQGKFSPKGDHFAWYHPLNGLFLYDFNRENGELSNFKQIEIPFGDFTTGGCEFSPNGRFLYVNHDTSLFQLDLMEENIQSSLTNIANFDGFSDPLPTGFFVMERTPDGRIILNTYNGSLYLHVIQEPNKKGLDCRFEQHSIKLPTINNFTLPHFPNYRLGALSDPSCDSLNVVVHNPTTNSQLSIFPNPATDMIYVGNDNSIEILNWIYLIYDMSGRLLIKSLSSNIDIDDLPEGLYMIRITGQNAPANMGKFVKVFLN